MATQTETSNNSTGKLIAGAAMRAGAAAALIIGGRAVINRQKGPRILGKPVPRNLRPKKIAKQVTKAADQLERTSDDVRLASQQVKRVAKKLA